MIPLMFINARLCDPARNLETEGQLVVEDGQITQIGQHVTPLEGARVIDCKGRLLCPGLIDMQVFTGEPGAEHLETLASASDAALSGGITSMAIMPNTEPTIDTAALVDFIKRRAHGTAQARIYPMGALTRHCAGQQMAELALMHEAGAIAFTDGDHCLAQTRLLRRLMDYASGFGFLICQHVEEASLVEGGMMHEGEQATRLGLMGIPWGAETIALARDMQLVEMTRARYHAHQISSYRSLDIIRRAKEKGLPVTCGVSACHLLLNDHDVGPWRTFRKLSPPLRSEKDREALCAGVADGSIDVIVSGHRPREPETKRLPFGEASFGSVGLETLLAASLSLYHRGHASLAQVLGALTCVPARILGLDTGHLEEGRPADLILLEPEAPWTPTPEALRSKSHNTALDGHPLQGLVELAVVEGKVVFQREPSCLTP